MTFDRILVPTDFSEAARHALLHAVHLASRYDAALHILHIEEVTEGYYERDEDLRARNEAQMHELLEEQNLSGLQVEHSIEAGEVVAPGILEYTAMHAPDLIVIGTQGRRRLKRLFMGSVAEEVVREATCPVMVIREHDRSFADKGIGRILVPLDLSENSFAALTYAKSLAKEYGSTMEVLHVFEDVNVPGIYGDVQNPLYDLPEARPRVEAEMRRAVGSADGPEVKVEYKMSRGVAARTIIDYVEEQAIDLVVLTSRGQSGVEHFVFGSVAEKVMRGANCAVLVVKKAGHA